MSAFVLPGSPSDHDAFIQDFGFVNVLGSFRACTYNVNHSSIARTLQENFNEIINNYRADVLILQEVKRRAKLPRMLKQMGYASRWVSPEFCIAWDKSVWSYVKSWRPQMSPTHYWTVNYALVVVLRHNETGKLVKFMSYHPPAHVQGTFFSGHAVVMRVLRQVVAKWNRMARNSVGHLDSCCFAGDDNVDELKGWRPKGGWEFMLHGPLRQVRAPEPTHHRRKIDDFRITEGLRPV